mgnify:FL=1
MSHESTETDKMEEEKMKLDDEIAELEKMFGKEL